MTISRSQEAARTRAKSGAGSALSLDVETQNLASLHCAISETRVLTCLSGCLSGAPAGGQLTDGLRIEVCDGALDVETDGCRDEETKGLGDSGTEEGTDGETERL